MRNLILLFITSLHLLAIGQSDSTDEFYYQWGISAGHASTQLTLFQSSGTFHQVFIDDVWSYEVRGVYEVKMDSIYLSCASDCQTVPRRILEPIIIEKHDESVSYSTVKIQSTSNEHLPNHTWDIISLSDTLKVLKVYENQVLVHTYQIKNLQSNVFGVYLPVSFKFYTKEENYRKVGFINDEFIQIEGRKYYYFVYPEEKKKWCIFKKKNK